MKYSSHGILIFSICSLLALASCKDKYENVTISWDKAEIQLDEKDPLLKINASLSTSFNEPIEMKVIWEQQNSSTYVGGDFLVSNSLYIKAHNTTSYMTLGPIDDLQIDGDDHLLLRLVTTNPKVSIAQSTCLVTIVDDDVIAPNTLQADLTWQRSNSHNNVSDVNLELYITNGAVITDGQLQSLGTVIASSETQKGFKTVKLSGADKNGPYLIIAYFQATFMDETVTFTINMNGMGNTNNSTSRALKDFQIGSIIVYGPFVISNNQFVPARATEPQMYHLTREEADRLHLIR